MTGQALQLTVYKYLFDFKEGIKLKTELIKMMAVTHPLAPNFV